LKKILRWTPELLIAAVAAALRLPGLGRAPLSESEARIWLFTTASWEHLRTIFLLHAERHSGTLFPYLAFLKLWSGWGGGEAWMRLPSLIAGIAAIVFAYLFASRIFGRAAGCVAALLLSVSSYHVMASRTAGATAIGVFLFTAVLYLFYRVYEGENRGWIAAALAVFAILGVNFGFHTALLILPMNILYLGFGRNRVRGLWWWIPLNIILIAAAAYWGPRWFATFFNPAPNFKVNEIFPSDVMQNETLFMLRPRMMIVEKYIEIIFALGGMYFFNSLANGWSFLGMLLVPVAYHYFPLIGFREYEDGYRPRLFAFITAGTLLGAAGLLSMTAAPIWETTIPASVVFFALMGNGASRFCGWRARALLALMVLCSIFGFVPMQRNDERARPDWRAVAAEAAADPSGAPIAFIDGTMSPPLLYYGRDIGNRIVSLMPNIDMALAGKKKYRQEQVLPLLKYRIDPYPPDGIADLFVGGSDVWIVRKGTGVPESPRWTKEYIIWLQSYASLVNEKEITPRLTVRGGRTVIPEDDAVLLGKWRLNSDLHFVPK
jgi:hypothetical protein